MDPDADNPTLIQVLVLERIDRDRNMARFYVLSIEPTLFEDLALVRRWGRMGARGASASICTGLGRSLTSSSRNGSIARGAADTSSGPDGRRPASGCRHVPRVRPAASARRSSYRCIMPLGEPLLWRQDFDWNSEWGPKKP